MSDHFDPSASAFLNALLREWDGWCVIDAHGGRAIEIPLRSREAAIHVPVRSLSLCGRHRFVFPALLRDARGASSPIAFADLAALIVNEEGIAGQIAPETAQRFLGRVLASARNISALLDARARDFERIFSEPLDFIEAEQALLTGHAIHPTPKSRDEFTADDARRYAPEFGDAFPLYWYAVSGERLLARSIAALSVADITEQLVSADPHTRAELVRKVPDGYTLLPAHPWQAARWTELAAVRGALDRGDIVFLGEAGAPWTATSSLRTVYAPHAPWMLKFSTSVRLTNSMRTLNIAELERGILLSRILQTELGADFTRRFPRFCVLPEPLYLGVRAGDGSAVEESIVAFRENPFLGRDSADTYVLATLLQDHPRRGVSRLTRHVTALAEAEQCRPIEAALRWFGTFLDVVLEPLMLAQADYGILLSAHQQNLIVRLRAGYPDQVWFRDGQGTAYTALAQELSGRELDLESHTFDGPRGNYFFSYSVIINTTFNVIAALAVDEGDEEPLLGALREWLCALRKRSPRDPSCLDYLLQSPRLWSKGNFFCCLRGVNEATIDDPLRIYHRIDNPLRLVSAS